MSLPDYYSRVNPDLLALIPPDCKVVLEIGCGAGALCEAYRRVNPGVEWLGAESNPEAVEVAKTHGVDVIQRDIEGDAHADGDGEIVLSFTHTKEMYRKEIDCLVFGDVLEHLRDPWTVMKRLTGFLAPGAQVLASIPNIQHWTVIRDLLSGKWEYQDEGLLDRTHLRFFCLSSIAEMFANAGLQVFEIRGRDLCNEGFDSWIVESGVKPCKEMRAYQFVVRALKPELVGKTWDCETDGNRRHMLAAGFSHGPKPIEKLHIHAVVAEGCCARPRIHEPFAALRTVPGVTCTTFYLKDDYNVPQGANIVIQQRFRSIGLLVQQSRLIERAIVVAELDDEPDTIGVNPVALRAVHAVQVSTERLAEIVRQWNPNVMVFPNQIADLPPFIPDDSSGGTPNAGIFFGAQNRQSDWAPIMPALNRIANDPSVVVWFDVVHDREFFDAIETDAKRFHPFLPYDQYRALLRTCDIALLPLKPTRFNECKSDIKFLECAAEGVAMVCSGEVYQKTMEEQDILTHESTRICAWHYDNRPAIFEKYLRGLIDHPVLRQECTSNAYEYVRDNRMLGGHFRKRLAWYQELLRTREELTRQLFERVPKLRPQHALTDFASSQQ